MPMRRKVYGLEVLEDNINDEIRKLYKIYYCDEPEGVLERGKEDQYLL